MKTKEQKIQKKLHRQSGQGMTEYIVIVALIAVAAIGVVTAFGDNVREVFATSTDALAGEGKEAKTREASGGVRQSRSLKDFAVEAKKGR